MAEFKQSALLSSATKKQSKRKNSESWGVWSSEDPGNGGLKTFETAAQWKKWSILAPQM